MEENIFTIKTEDYEDMKLYLNGELIGSYNHDEHGWAGMESVERVVKVIATKIGAKVVDER